jgi:integrase
MASVVKNPGGKIWIACFRDSKGKQHRNSTHETDRKRAQKVADQLEAATRPTGNSVKVRQAFQAFFREHFGQDMPDVTTVREFFTRWLSIRKPEIALNSFLTYQSAAKRFLDFLGDRADRAIEEVTTKDILAYREQLVASISAGNVNAAISVLHQAFRAARIDGYVIQDPAEAVRTVRCDRSTSIRRPFTLAELRAVLTVASPEWQSIIKFGFYTGQRLFDIASLTWNQIDLENEELRIIAQKTGKSVMIPIVGALKEHVLSLPAGDNPRYPVHPRAYGIITTDKRSGRLSVHFGDLLIAAGLRQVRQADAVRSRRRASHELCFHSLRHTTNSLLKAGGASESVTMKLLGHQSPEISGRYTHVEKEALIRAAEMLPEI